jgi:amino acid adenylation domain-containing protein
VHELFEKQVEDRADAVALVHQSRRVTYRELNRLANGVARELQRWNLPPDSVVALCVERSPEMVAGMLGILKAGAAYLPLNPTDPPERLAMMLADSDAHVLLTQSALLHRFPRWSEATLIVDDIRGCDGDTPPAITTPESLAYVMYTSGSTGTPKGVEIPHRGIVRLLFGTDYARFGPDRVFLQMAPFSFDASTFEIWGALLHGGRCVLYPEATPLASTLGTLLRSEQVTTLWLTSSLFNALIDGDPAALSTVEQLLTGGEALSVRHVARALELLPNTEIINGYGPTESTTFACCYRIPRDWQKLPDSIPIGQPIGRTQAYILDDQLAPVPVGQIGEIYIGGDGLARGYRNRPELTRAAFVPNPLRQDGTRLYRTGDLARCLPDGNIEFLGRKDDQVKIRGFRIELGEIEAALARHPAVEQAAVRVYDLTPGDKHLAAYMVMARRQVAAAAELRGYLSDRLPGYMIPSSFQIMDRLPLTANGKLDRHALPLPGELTIERSTDQTETHDPVEISLARMWRELLGMKSVGANDDFFELGGHSLLAARLITRVEREFGIKLSLAALFQAPTLSQLAALVRSNSTLRPDELIPIQPAGSRPPFLCIDGGPLFYSLVKRLDLDQPFLGVPEPDCASLPVPYRLEDLAAARLRSIRRSQAEGPYFLGGFSASSTLAYEVAQQLRAEGQEVSLLVLFDGENPLAEKRRISGLGARLRFHALNLAHGEVENVLSYLRDRWISFKFLSRIRIWSVSYRVHQRLGRRLPRWMQHPRDILFHCYFFQYRPEQYPGRVLLFRHSKETGETSADELLGWGGLLTGRLEVCEVPGDHWEIFGEPSVRVMAEKLSESLIDAQKS